MKTNGLPSLPNTPAAEHEQPTWQDDEISLLDLLLVLVRNWRLIGYTVVLFASVGLLYTLTADAEYTASAKVIREAVEEGTTSFGGLSMLRGLGINLGGTSSGLSVDAYSDVLNSREVRSAVITDTFYIRELNRRMPFIEYKNQPGVLETWFGIGNDEGPENGDSLEWQTLQVLRKEERALKALADIVRTSIDRETGLMTISATTGDPQLSEALVRSIVNHLSDRVREIHTEKARLNVEFIRTRFEEAGRALREAEEDLARFLDQNNSPQTARLRTELERYQRNVSFKSELYSELQAQLTQAELNLQKIQPVITVLEEPVPPTKPDAARLSVPLCIVLGLFVGILLAFARSAFTKAISSDEERHKVEEIRVVISHLKWPGKFSRNPKIPL